MSQENKNTSKDMASFSKMIGDSYGKTLMGTATKTVKDTEIDAAKTASKSKTTRWMEHQKSAYHQKSINTYTNRVPRNRKSTKSIHYKIFSEKRIKVYDQSGGAFNTNKQIKLKTSVL